MTQSTISIAGPGLIIWCGEDSSVDVWFSPVIILYKHVHVYWLSGTPEGTPESINVHRFKIYVEEEELIKTVLLYVLFWAFTKWHVHM